MIGAVAIVAVGATGAFFSDTETSTGNTFTAGAIDLGIDNTSYYNGVFQNGENGTETTTWALDWDIDNTEYPGNNPATTEVENGYSLPTPRQFFNFGDLKPGDYGEDTISAHVTNNDSWLCADVKLTKDDDNTCVEPEEDSEGAGICNNASPAANADGDLADQINFLWWADDGDNVLESDETPLLAGPLGALAVGQTAHVRLADSTGNIWGGSGPLSGSDTRYIGKAWCFGNIAPAPLSQSSVTANNRATSTPAENGDGVISPLVPGQPTDGGYTCTGASVIDNKAQTDQVTLDIGFRAEQSRHNAGFLCSTPVISL